MLACSFFYVLNKKFKERFIILGEDHLGPFSSGKALNIS